MLRLVLVLAVTWLVPRHVQGRYEPTWESLDTRPLPQWYDDAKFGIFLHWGVYSVPSFGDAWFWKQWHDGDKAHVRFMERNYRPGFTYADFAPKFTAEFFDPHWWAKLFQAAGAKYVVLTTKHHEGFTLWPSKYAWNWNAVDVGPKRDLVGDLADAVRNFTDIHFGVYHSLFEFFNPFWLSDQASNFTQVTFPAAKTIPELHELISRYRPDVIWSDGSSQAPSSDYWGSKEFLAWLYNDSPIRDRVVTNDRWGKDAGCAHGDFITCHDHFNPGVLQKRKWENCLTVDRGSWGFRRDVSLADIRSMEELTAELVETVSCGGNMLLNVGPTHDGRIVPIFEERLRQMGEWLGINGESIYATQPWTNQNDSSTPGVWYTQRKSYVYILFLKWPADGKVMLGSLRLKPSEGKLTLLGGSGKELKWTQKPGKKLVILLPPLEHVTSRWAWVIRAEHALAAEKERLPSRIRNAMKSHSDIRPRTKATKKLPPREKLTMKIDAMFGTSTRKDVAFWMNSIQQRNLRPKKKVLHRRSLHKLP